MSDVEALLREILVEIRGLRGDLQRVTGPPPADDGLAELIHAIDRAAANRVFTAAEIIGFCALDVSLCKSVKRFCPRDPRKLGKVFQRYDGIFSSRGLAIVRVSECRDGAIWSVMRRGSRGSDSRKTRTPRCQVTPE